MGYTPPPRPHAIPWVVKYRDGAVTRTQEYRATSEASARGMAMREHGIAVKDIIDVEMRPQNRRITRNPAQDRLL